MISIIVQITSRNASKAYLEMIDKSYIGSSDEVLNTLHENLYNSTSLLYPDLYVPLFQ